MEVIFDYSKEKDIWCLLNKGKSSNNNPNPTKVYELLVERCGENPTGEATSFFIDEYLAENSTSIDIFRDKYAEEWLRISDEYHNRAEAIFDVSLPLKVTAYLTINNRNPYSISDNLFYVTIPRETVRKTIMHELWHFYTWYGLGIEQENILGKEKYNTAKEALTVLLNVEYADLLPAGVSDVGYPQHQKLRQDISDMWQNNKDLKSLWKEITK
jgi:hypothetical protein